AGRGEDVDADLPEELAHFQAGGGETFRQGRCERTVPRGVAVLRLLPVARRELDEGGAVRRDAGETAGDARPPACGKAHLGEEGIVAAGIDDDEAEGAHPVDGRDHAIEGNRLVRNVAVRGELRIDGNDIVDAVELKSVTSEIDHRPIGTGRNVGKLIE